jgi:hypothetical protein
MDGKSQQEINNSLISSLQAQQMPLSVLARRLSSKRAVDFLMELANCRVEDAEAREGFVRRFQEFCPGRFPGPSGLPDIRHELITAWKEPTLRDREAWLLTPLADALHFGLSSEAMEPSVDEGDDIEDRSEDARRWGNIVAALYQSLKIADRMRVCGNPECLAPFFLARRRSQKYCSAACAAPAVRELKRAWWNEHGLEWSRARRKATKAKVAARKAKRKRGGSR